MGQAGRRVLVWMLGAVLFCGTLFAQTAEQARTPKKRWILSAIALVGANVADSISSRGGYETNPLLRGPGGAFGGNQAIAIKFGITGAALGAQWLLLRRNPTASALNGVSVANFAAAGALSAVAVHNFRVTDDSPKTSTP